MKNPTRSNLCSSALEVREVRGDLRERHVECVSRERKREEGGRAKRKDDRKRGRKTNLVLRSRPTRGCTRQTVLDHGAAVGVCEQTGDRQSL